MAITGLVHVNINCSDFARSKVFYESLGFREFYSVLETNTPEIAAAVGMPPYQVKGALMMLEDATDSPFPLTINLLEWLDPRDEEPPYPHLYHYGIARIALRTTDLNGDMAKLKALGAEFISEPVQMPPSTGSNARFVCFKDPDGTVLELVENPTPRVLNLKA
jgi:catechol 2,3-dioxygenase-like lactoylglutathione lyase family enzyme